MEVKWLRCAQTKKIPQSAGNSWVWLKTTSWTSGQNQHNRKYSSVFCSDTRYHHQPVFQCVCALIAGGRVTSCTCTSPQGCSRSVVDGTKATLIPRRFRQADIKGKSMRGGGCFCKENWLHNQKCSCYVNNWEGRNVPDEFRVKCMKDLNT